MLVMPRSPLGCIRCDAPLMHALPLILPVCSSFRKSNKDRTFTLTSLANFEGSIGVHVSIMCCCVSLSIAAVAPLTPNFGSPEFRLYYVMRYPHTFISSSNSVTSAGSMECSVLLIPGSVPVHVVACTLSSLFIPIHCSASRTLLCAHTSLSCRKVVLGAYVLYGWFPPM